MAHLNSKESKMDNTVIDRLITREELRAYLNISKSTEWRMQQKGLLPKTVTVGGRILGYLLSAYLKWIKDNS